MHTMSIFEAFIHIEKMTPPDLDIFLEKVWPPLIHPRQLNCDHFLMPNYDKTGALLNQLLLIKRMIPWGL